MTTYTVISNSGIAQRGLTLEQAAIERLTDDGHEYRLIARDGMFELHVRNPHLSGSRFALGYTGHGSKALISFEASEDAAWQDLCRMVISAAWRGCPEVMTDANYDAMMAESE